MKARPLFHEKVVRRDGSIVEAKVWAVSPDVDKRHGYKSSLVYVKEGKHIVGYDNGERKGDHRHYGSKELPYEFR